MNGSGTDAAGNRSRPTNYHYISRSRRRPGIHIGSADDDGRLREADRPGAVLGFDEPLGLVQLSEREAEADPLREVFGDGDAPALARALPDAEVLIEGLVVARDGRLVDARLLPDLV